MQTCTTSRDFHLLTLADRAALACASLFQDAEEHDKAIIMARLKRDALVKKRSKTK